MVTAHELAEMLYRGDIDDNEFLRLGQTALREIQNRLAIMLPATDAFLSKKAVWPFVVNEGSPAIFLSLNGTFELEGNNDSSLKLTEPYNPQKTKDEMEQISKRRAIISRMYRRIFDYCYRLAFAGGEQDVDDNEDSEGYLCVKPEELLVAITIWEEHWDLQTEEGLEIELERIKVAPADRGKKKLIWLSSSHNLVALITALDKMEVIQSPSWETLSAAFESPDGHLTPASLRQIHSRARNKQPNPIDHLANSIIAGLRPAFPDPPKARGK